MRVILGLYWDSGNRQWKLLYFDRGYVGVILGHGNCYIMIGLILALYWGNGRIMEKRMETAIRFRVGGLGFRVRGLGFRI